MPQTSLHSQGYQLLERLVEHKHLTREKMEHLSRAMAQSAEPPGDFLIRQAGMPRDIVLEQWSAVLGVEAIRLDEESIDSDVTHDVPESLARELQIMPVHRRGNWLTLAMVDPLDVVAIDRVRFLTGLEVKPALGLACEITDAIARFYSVNATMEAVFQDAARRRENDADLDLDGTDEDLMIMDEVASRSEDAPVVKIVNLLLNQALKDRASDIHIEPEDEFVRVRFRIDGVLQDKAHPPKPLHSGIVTRVKILSRMDISEKRAPQDGQFTVTFRGHRIDLRVSTLPTVRGEKVVMRILDSRSVLVGLDNTGIGPEELRIWRELIRLPGGILLVTGPTGSGKSTTLYGSLNEINSPELNIVTVEDPVEYKLPSIGQIQVNPRAGVTFATGLRSILRQDPDVIMVGEIRDQETADIAIRAALTGHLVFSTLHTTEAAGTLMRLRDMGLEPYLVASSVRAVLAQRLVRVLCPHCREEAHPDKLLRDRVLDPEEADGPFYTAPGCRRCLNVGYSGRIGVYELMRMSDGIRHLMLQNADSATVRAKAVEEGMSTLRRDAVAKARRGITSLEEVARVTLVAS
jgi:type IV pilus assembly protein PilB